MFFQCKRYKGSVGSAAVHDFRSAMAGRGDNGLLITINTFTGEAKELEWNNKSTEVDIVAVRRLDNLSEWTTYFISATRVEAAREGHPPIDLIDGNRLCGLLKEYDLGVKTTVHQVEDITVDTEFFADI